MLPEGILQPGRHSGLVSRKLVPVGSRCYAQRVALSIGETVVEHGDKDGADDAHLQLGKLEDLSVQMR